MSLTPLFQNDISDIAKVFGGYRVGIPFIFFTLFNNLKKETYAELCHKKATVVRQDEFVLFGKHFLTINAKAEISLNKQTTRFGDEYTINKISDMVVDIDYRTAIADDVLTIDEIKNCYSEHFGAYATSSVNRFLQDIQ